MDPKSDQNYTGMAVLQQFFCTEYKNEAMPENALSLFLSF